MYISKYSTYSCSLLMDMKIFQDYHIGLSATKGYSHQVSLIVPFHAGSKHENNTTKKIFD